MSTRDDYVQKMQAKLDEWNADIDKLAAKADAAQADAKLKYQEQVEKLKTQRDAARHKLDELGKSSEGAWEDLRTGVELAWDSISMAIRDAIARFK